jgi:hypothetical protein
MKEGVKILQEFKRAYEYARESENVDELRYEGEMMDAIQKMERYDQRYDQLQVQANYVINLLEKAGKRDKTKVIPEVISRLKMALRIANSEEETWKEIEEEKE